MKALGWGNFNLLTIRCCKSIVSASVRVMLKNAASNCLPFCPPSFRKCPPFTIVLPARSCDGW